MHRLDFTGIRLDPGEARRWQRECGRARPFLSHAALFGAAALAAVYLILEPIIEIQPGVLARVQAQSNASAKSARTAVFQTLAEHIPPSEFMRTAAARARALEAAAEVGRNLAPLDRRRDARVAIIEGQPFIGRRFLLVKDVSGSMNDAQRQTRLSEHLARLNAAGISSQQTSDVAGVGVSATGGQNLLTSIEQAIAANSAIDAVYAFSDFNATGASYWQSDSAGYARLQELLRRNGCRLYLGTVDQSPPAELVKIAQNSGGGIIP